MGASSLPSPDAFLSPVYSPTGKQRWGERLRFVLRVPPAQKGATAKNGGGSSGHPSIRRDGVPSLPKDFPISWPQSPRQTGWHQCRSAEPKSFLRTVFPLCVCAYASAALSPYVCFLSCFFLNTDTRLSLSSQRFCFRQFSRWASETKFLS